MYRYDLDKVPEVKVKIPVDLKLLDLNNISRILEVKNLKMDRLRDRLQRGDLCYVCEFEEKIISYHWLQTTGEHYIQQAGKNVEILNEEAYVYHVRVNDTYKGNRINGYVYSQIIKYLREKDYYRLWVYTNRKNNSNRKSLESIGFKIDHFILSLKFGNTYYQFFKT